MLVNYAETENKTIEVEKGDYFTIEAQWPFTSDNRFRVACVIGTRHCRGGSVVEFSFYAEEDRKYRVDCEVLSVSDFLSRRKWKKTTREFYTEALEMMLVETAGSSVG